jgi:hypothetical protein
MCRPDAGETSGLGFDQCLEVFAADCALLLQVEADLGELFGRQHFIEDSAPRCLALDRGAAQVLPGWVFAEPGRRTLAQVGWTAGPAIGHWLVDQARANRVEFDISVAAQHVVLAIHQACFVAAFPQCAGPTMPGIE